MEKYQSIRAEKKTFFLQYFKQMNIDEFPYIDNTMNVQVNAQVCECVNRNYQSIAPNRIQQLSYCSHP